jgi:sec-independent protein translocase protein TatB
MFEVGLIELVVIGVVMLLVVGPERLPGVARTAGRWYAKAQRFVTSVTSEIRRELAADELRQALNKHAAFREDFQELADEAGKIGAEIKAATQLETPATPAGATEAPTDTASALESPTAVELPASDPPPADSVTAGTVP